MFSLEGFRLHILKAFASQVVVEPKASRQMQQALNFVGRRLIDTSSIAILIVVVRVTVGVLAA